MNDFLQVYVGGVLHCGKCGHAMMFAGKHDENVFPPVVVCTNRRCEENGVTYRTPTLILERLP